MAAPEFPGIMKYRHNARKKKQWMSAILWYNYIALRRMMEMGWIEVVLLGDWG